MSNKGNAMTVEELIIRLQKFPPKTVVATFERDDYYGDAWVDPDHGLSTEPTTVCHGTSGHRHKLTPEQHDSVVFI